MDVRFSAHASLRMLELGLSREDVIQVIDSPDSETQGTTAVEAEKRLGRQLWRVVYTDKDEFILVITVHPIEAS